MPDTNGSIELTNAAGLIRSIQDRSSEPGAAVKSTISNDWVERNHQGAAFDTSVIK
jgi:hypothetical protein